MGEEKLSVREAKEVLYFTLLSKVGTSRIGGYAQSVHYSSRPEFPDNYLDKYSDEYLDSLTLGDLEEIIGADF